MNNKYTLVFHRQNNYKNLNPFIMSSVEKSVSKDAEYFGKMRDEK
jgi:hypothetical protein